VSSERTCGGSGELPPLNETFLEHALTPSNLGMLPQPEAYGRHERVCGDALELYLRVREGAIVDARFMTEGCLATIACGSALTSLIKGRSVQEAAQVTPEDLQEAVGGLPPGEEHCADMAVGSLRQAVSDYYSKLHHPWKAFYGQRPPRS
jgi:NifU-like protein involved in Fe-S cluster formation